MKESELRQLIREEREKLNEMGTLRHIPELLRIFSSERYSLHISNVVGFIRSKPEFFTKTTDGYYLNDVGKSYIQSKFRKVDTRNTEPSDNADYLEYKREIEEKIEELKDTITIK